MWRSLNGSSEVLQGQTTCVDRMAGSLERFIGAVERMAQRRTRMPGTTNVLATPLSIFSSMMGSIMVPQVPEPAAPLATKPVPAAKRAPPRIMCNRCEACRA